MKEISFNLIDNILVFGNAQLSTQLLKAMANRDIFVFYFSEQRRVSIFMIPLGRKILTAQSGSRLPLTRTLGHCSGESLRPRSEIINLLQAFDENDLLDQEDFQTI